MHEIWAVKRVVLCGFSGFATVAYGLSESRKLWSNLWSRKCLKTTPNLVRYVKTKESRTLKMLFGWSLINSNIVFLNN